MGQIVYTEHGLELCASPEAWIVQEAHGRANRTYHVRLEDAWREVHRRLQKRKLASSPTARSVAEFISRLERIHAELVEMPSSAGLEKRGKGVKKPDNRPCAADVPGTPGGVSRRE